MTGYAILPTTGIVIVCAFSTKLFARISMMYQKQRQKEGDILSKNRWSAYENIVFIKLEALENFFLEKIVASKIKQLYIGLKKSILDNILGTVNVIFTSGMIVTLFGFYM